MCKTLGGFLGMRKVTRLCLNRTAEFDGTGGFQDTWLIIGVFSLPLVMINIYNVSKKKKNDKYIQEMKD